MVMRYHGKGVGCCVVNVISRMSATIGMRFRALDMMPLCVSCAEILDPLLVSMCSFSGTNV